MPDAKTLAEQILQRFLKSQLKKKVHRLCSVISVLKQNLTARSGAQKRAVDVGNAPNRSMFTARYTSSPGCLKAPQLWYDRSKHGVEYAGDGKWMFHQTVTSQVTMTSVSGGQYKMSPGLIRGHQSAITSSSLHAAFVCYRSGLSQIVCGERFKPLGCELLPKPSAGHGWTKVLYLCVLNHMTMAWL